MSDKYTSYGICPVDDCDARGYLREHRPNGHTTCEKVYKVLSREYKGD